MEPVKHVDQDEILASALVTAKAADQLLLDRGVVVLVGTGAERAAALLLLVEEVEVRCARRGVGAACGVRLGGRVGRGCGRCHGADRKERQRNETD